MSGRKNGDVDLILVGETNIQGRRTPAKAFKNVLSILRSADILFGHMEAPLTAPSQDPALPDIPHKTGWRHSDPITVQAFIEAGFDAVSLASNVMYGPRAALDTVEALDRAGIGHCGAGRNLQEARSPAVVASGGFRLGFQSYTSVFWPVGHAAGLDSPGVATVKAHTAYEPGRRALEMPGAPPKVATWADPAELEAMQSDIEALRGKVDMVIASFHWGVSGSSQVVGYQREIARAAIMAGADLVMGHHPHRLQGIEIVAGKPVLYSMGNFAFDWDRMRGRNLEGMLVRCTVRERELHSLSFVPVRRNQDNLVEALDPARGPGEAIVERVRELSAAFGTRISVADGKAIVGMTRSAPSAVTDNR